MRWSGNTYGGGSGARSSAHGASVERGPGDDVGRLGLSSVGVDVECDTGVTVAVSTRERDELGCGGRKVSATGDLDLSTLGVELLLGFRSETFSPSV